MELGGLREAREFIHPGRPGRNGPNAYWLPSTLGMQAQLLIIAAQRFAAVDGMCTWITSGWPTIHPRQDAELGLLASESNGSHSEWRVGESPFGQDTAVKAHGCITTRCVLSFALRSHTSLGYAPPAPAWRMPSISEDSERNHRASRVKTERSRAAVGP